MNKKIAIVGAIVLVIAVVLVIVLGNFGGTSDTPITPDTTPPISTEQNTPAPDTSELDKGEEQPDTSDTTPVVPEDNQQDETPSTVPEDNQQEETTPSVDTTPEVVEPTPEPSVTPDPTPSTQPEVADPTPSPEPTPNPSENTNTPDSEVSKDTQTEQEQGTQVQQGQQGSQTQKGDGTNVNDYKTEVGVNYDQMYADWAANQKNMTIKYGELRTNRPAVAGDTYIKKDGTKIVLKIGPSGVVGEGQGVCADLGLTWGSNKYLNNIVHVNGEFRYDNTTVGNDQCGLTSTGAPLMGQMYTVNKSTGEGHFGAEWNAIYSNDIYLDYIRGVEGKYDGQISSDPLKLWVWDAANQEWDRNQA